MFFNVSRVLRQNGKCVLFGQEPYTSNVITSSIPSLPLSYRAVWIKNNHANPFIAKKAMVNLFEDICIFSKLAHDYNGGNPLRKYFKKVLEFIGAKSAKEINIKLGHRRAEHCFYVTGNENGSTQFRLCTENTYNELIDFFKIDKMEGFIKYQDLDKKQLEYDKIFSSTFNLWQGGKSKGNVLVYQKDSSHFHPTQKPVALLEDLVQTFSNPGDTVLDFAMGSGSTGVACVNTGRNFIGIELDPQYFEIAKSRIEEAKK